MNAKAAEVLNTYCGKYPFIAAIEKEIRAAVEIICNCFENGGALYVCGNGGSCADADHIVGELVKAFRMPRPLEPALDRALSGQGEEAAALAGRLQSGLRAFNLGAQTALMTAIINDMGADDIFAQQIAAYGKAGDVLLGLSTSGNSKNVLYAGMVAQAKGMKTIGLTGRTGGKMGPRFDLVLRA